MRHPLRNAWAGSGSPRTLYLNRLLFHTVTVRDLCSSSAQLREPSQPVVAPHYPCRVSTHTTRVWLYWRGLVGWGLGGGGCGRGRVGAVVGAVAGAVVYTCLVSHFNK